MGSFNDFLANSKGSTYKVQEVEAKRLPRRVLEFPQPAPFYINKVLKPVTVVTRRWMRSAADERAAEEFGCHFSEQIGMYVVNWLEDNCILYEGHKAGDPITIEDWQYEFEMQMHGWILFDPEIETIMGTGKGWVRRYKEVSGWVPKKNAKSPTLAATGFYHFAGDGEQGQHCFSLALDFEQAKQAHAHAEQYVRKHRDYGKRFKIDGTSLEITDRWTNSSYKIICGNKGSLANSKEGKNGSFFVDEAHVINREIIKIIKRAGISRRQPVHVELSTAGKDMAGYGYERYELGKNNLKAADEGRAFDHRLLFFEYAIPQETSVDDLRDPGKIDTLIRMSNPTLGRITRVGEVKEDWGKSQRSDTELIEFAMYRLNQWNSAGGAFIAGSDWKRCSGRVLINELKDYPCVIGLDMSRCADMVGLVLCWAVPKVVNVLVDQYDPDCTETEEREINIPHIKSYHWLPRKTAYKYRERIRLEALAEQKKIFLTDSPMIRAEDIAEQLNFYDNKLNIVAVASDMAYSRGLSACLSGTHSWDTDEKLCLVPPTFPVQGPAIEQLKACILNQQFVHDNGDIMNWQLGNISVIEDTNGNQRFQKPMRNDWRKIDGWAALVNAIFYMMNTPDMYPGSTVSIKMGVS